MKRIILISLAVAAATILATVIGNRASSTVLAGPAEGPKPASDDLARQVEALQKQVKQLEGLVPDQAAVMTKVAYHFTNLYVAVQKENWPLADFYLGETLNNIKWAVRTRPIRKDSSGKDVDLAAIAQAIENTQFTELKQAIAAQDKSRCMKAYDDTLAGCYACHIASSKPYLKPQPPSEAEVKILKFDPEPVVAK